MHYPQDLEQLKTDTEERLLRLLIQGRAREALMSCRNLEKKSFDYLEAVEDLLSGTDHAPEINEMIREHLNVSMQRQEGAALAAGRLMESLPKGAPKRGVFAEILSVMNLCIHSNVLVRRTATVSLGKSLAEKRIIS